MAQTLPTSFFSTSRAILSLSREIEAVTGHAVSALPRGTRVTWQGSGSVLPASRRSVVVAPGPLVSPYDSPDTGFASLRIGFGGRPLGGVAPSPDLADRLRRLRLSGRNRFGTTDRGPFEDHPEPPALVLVGPGLSESEQEAFIDRALRTEADARLVVAGPYGAATPRSPTARLVVLSEPADIWSLSERASRVYVANSSDGCESRLAGADVICCGQDHTRPLADEAPLLALRYGEGVHAFDPWTRRPIALGEAAERVAWLRDRFAGNGRRVVYVGISRWKRPALDAFADGPQGAPIHTMTAEAAVAAAIDAGAEVRAWATRMPEQLAGACERAGVPLSRVEDGFLRSVGLGASLQPGASIVVDDAGIYYDPRTESRLARILKETAFAPDLVARAGRLREAIVARRLSKYNVGSSLDALAWPSDRRIVLVPGQVEDDASVRYGSPMVRSNLDLLRAARARNPDAFLLYKPHPDVEAGFRRGKIPEREVTALADGVVGGLAIVDLLDRVHHVETMTSLAGFEALIRGLSVAVHGRPFYSGWGLSEDLAPGADRGRRLALDELVAGTLILYPSYLDPVAMKPCEPERLLERLSAARDESVPSALAIGRVRHAIMRLRYALLNPIVRRLRARRGVGGTLR